MPVPRPPQLKGVIEAVVTEEIEADTEQITSYKNRTTRPARVDRQSGAKCCLV